MAIQDEMYKLIEKEINQVIESENGHVIVNPEKTKKVARMLTALSTEKREADDLINQYMANIKDICKG
jgi:hypothetical protein